MNSRQSTITFNDLIDEDEVEDLNNFDHLIQDTDYRTSGSLAPNSTRNRMAESFDFRRTQAAR